jgi:hypothetical protein
LAFCHPWKTVLGVFYWYEDVDFEPSTTDQVRYQHWKENMEMPSRIGESSDPRECSRLDKPEIFKC